MELEQLQLELITRFSEQQLISGVISQSRSKTESAGKIKIKPVEIKGLYHIQLEYHFDQTITHENKLPSEMEETVRELLDRYRQLQMNWAGESVHIQLSKKKK